MTSYMSCYIEYMVTTVTISYFMQREKVAAKFKLLA